MGVRRTQRLAVAGAVFVGLVLSLAGCALSSSVPPSGANDLEVVAARESAAADQESVLAAAAMGDVLSESVRDRCERGVYSRPWGPFDSYYWSCRHATSWIVGTDLTDPAELIATYQEHLSAVGCEPDEADFGMTSRYWELYGVPGETANGDPYTVDDLPTASAECDGALLGVGFRSATGYDPSPFGAFSPVDGELILDQPHDEASIQAGGSALVVTLITGSTYHEVPRTPSDTSDDEPATPLPCACYSGSDCNCPGG